MRPRLPSDSTRDTNQRRTRPGPTASSAASPLGPLWQTLTDVDPGEIRVCGGSRHSGLTTLSRSLQTRRVTGRRMPLAHRVGRGGERRDPVDLQLWRVASRELAGPRAGQPSAVQFRSGRGEGHPSRRGMLPVSASTGKHALRRNPYEGGSWRSPLRVAPGARIGRPNLSNHPHPTLATGPHDQDNRCQDGRRHFSFVARAAARSLLPLRDSGDPEQKPPVSVVGYIETAGPS